MGHQVNFFLLPSDLPTIEDAIRKTGDVCFLSDRTPTAEPTGLETLALDLTDTGGFPLHAYVARREDLGNVTMRHVPAQGYWLIDSTRSPVIELDRCFFDGSVLKRGRMYFATDLRFLPELPDPDFVKWGDRVLNRLRKNPDPPARHRLPALHRGRCRQLDTP